MELNFSLVGNATWVLEVDKKFKIGCDPALSPQGTKYGPESLMPQRIKTPVYDERTFDNVKIWLLTHGHFDHLDQKGLGVIQDGSSVVSHKNCSAFLKNRKNLNISYLTWHQKKGIEIENYRIEIEAVPAVHGTTFLTKTLMGGVNGYLVTIRHDKDTKTIYVSSDTVFVPEIPAALHNRIIDLFIPNMGQAHLKIIGGPITMNREMLKKFMSELKPTLTLPVHVDDFSHFGTLRSDLMKSEGINLKVLENGESYKIM